MRQRGNRVNPEDEKTVGKWFRMKKREIRLVESAMEEVKAKNFSQFVHKAVMERTAEVLNK